MMKKILFLLYLLSYGCMQPSENCHYDIIVNNNSSSDIVFGISGFGNNGCYLGSQKVLNPNTSAKYSPFRGCIERFIGDPPEIPILFIVSSLNFTTDSFPCEEFEERNTILRTYILTLEDLERLDYTINYPEDASIGVE